MVPSFASSSEPEKIPAFPVPIKLLGSLNLFGINSFIFFHSLNLSINFFITLIPSSVVKTGNLGIFIR